MLLTRAEENKIKDIGKKFGLKLIILHGSYATGKVRPESDIDIGVLGKGFIPYQTLTDIFFEMEKVFGNSRKRELDVKSLHRIDPLFRHQVAKDSQLLYGDMTDYNEFRAYAFRLYHDSADLFKLEELLINRYQDHLNQKYHKKYA